MFWEDYPLKVGKADAQKAWRQVAGFRPRIGDLLRALRFCKQSRSWTTKNAQGRFPIPYAGTWLRRHGWLDQPDGVPPPTTADEAALAAAAAEREAALGETAMAYLTDMIAEFASEHVMDASEESEIRARIAEAQPDPKKMWAVLFERGFYVGADKLMRRKEHASQTDR